MIRSGNIRRFWNSTLIVVVGALVGIACFVVGMRRTVLSSEGDRPDRSGLVELRFPTSDLPAIVHSVHLSLERKGGGARADSFVVRREKEKERSARFTLPAGSWALYIRGKDAEGWTRYAGMEYLEVDESTQLTGIVRMNPMAGQTMRKEVLIRWGDKPERWEMSVNNPVIAADPTGWDADHYYLINPTVAQSGSTYYLWYGSGYSPYYTGLDSIMIAVAISIDGETWMKRGPVRFVSPRPSWVKSMTLPGAALVENNEFLLWFSTLTSAIGVARSSDGITWTIDPNPVVEALPAFTRILGPSVVQWKGMYYMFFSARQIGKPEEPDEIWMRISTDAKNWSPPRSVLRRRPNIAWERSGLTWPCVYSTEHDLRMIYSCSQVMGAELGEARSTDAINWIRDELTPAMTSDDTRPWSTTGVNCAHVHCKGPVIRLWFSGLSEIEARWQIGYAERHVDGPH
ncbi:MAG: hypothetical protein MUF82_01415 [Bacteroidetes bacterium]|nr:hypothetical protein [Bacteroidota bacterium]